MQTGQPTTEQLTNLGSTANQVNANNAIKAKTKVPLPVLIICILGAAGFGLTAGGVILGWKIFAAIGTFFLIYNIITTAAGLLAIIWLFQMKKKGAYLYAGLFIIGQIMMVVYGVWALNLTFIIGLAVTGITLFYSKDMH